MAPKRPLLALLLLLLLRRILAFGTVTDVRGYIVLLQPKSSVKAAVSDVAKRTADPSDTQFAASIDTRSVFGDAPHPVAAGFRIFCDERTARLVARQRGVRLVEVDSDISVDGY